MRKRFFEDFQVGMKFSGRAPGLSKGEITSFAQKWDPQPFHTDEAAATASQYGGLIASGFQTMLLLFGPFVNEVLINSEADGSPGLREVRWHKPLRAGVAFDTVAEITGKSTSRSRPEIGFIAVRLEGRDDDGQLICSIETDIMVRRNPDS